MKIIFTPKLHVRTNMRYERDDIEAMPTIKREGNMELKIDNKNEQIRIWVDHSLRRLPTKKIYGKNRGLMVETIVVQSRKYFKRWYEMYRYELKNGL